MLALGVAACTGTDLTQRFAALGRTDVVASPAVSAQATQSPAIMPTVAATGSALPSSPAASPSATPSSTPGTGASSSVDLSPMSTPSATPGVTPSPEPTPSATPEPVRQQAWAPAALWLMDAGFGSGMEHGPSTAVGGVLGDGLPSVDAYLSKPAGLGVLPDGRLLVLDRGHGVIRVDDGIARTWAGQVPGVAAAPDAPVPVQDVRLLGASGTNLPGEMAVGPDGSVWLVDGLGQLLLLPAASGSAYGRDVVAGLAYVVPLPGALGKPNGLAVGPDGSLVFTVANQNKVGVTVHRNLYMLDKSGVVTTLAGNGSAVGIVDEEGLPLLEAPIAGPSSPYGDRDGQVWFSEVSTQIVAQADGATQSVSVARVMMACLKDMQAFGRQFVAGRVYPMLGAGPRTPYSAKTDTKAQVDQGDGLPGLVATVFKASSLSMTPDGHFVYVDPTLGRLRLLDRQTGIVHRLAGPGPDAEPVQAVPLTEARLVLPTYLTVDLSGDIWISDFTANRVRRVRVAP